MWLVRGSPCSRGDGDDQQSAGHEFQGHAVDAVTETGGFRSIFKHVALVALTSRAMDFRSGHEEFEISSSLDHAWIDWLPEAGPTGTAVELVVGREERQVATGAIIDT
jgi:hypothetical protein